jgi:hypothetical protein
MRILSAASRKTCLSCELRGCRAQHWYASGNGWPSLFWEWWVVDMPWLGLMLDVGMYYCASSRCSLVGCCSYHYCFVLCILISRQDPDNFLV